MNSATKALLVASLLSATTALAASVAEVLANTTAQIGLLPVHVDLKDGRILLSLPAPDRDGISGRFIYATSLKTGLGSALLGLDRASVSSSKLLVFRRVGKKVVAEIENPRFRAAGAPAPEQAAARESFAYSTLWMGDIAAEIPGGRVLVDVASLLTSDTMGIAQALNDRGEKGFSMAAGLSVADPGSVKVFPENIEMEARQTFVSPQPGAEVSNIAPLFGNLSLHCPALACEATGARLPGAPVRSAVWERGRAGARLCGAARHPDRPEPREALPAREDRSPGSALAREEADRLLHRSLRARAHPLGAL